MTITALPPAPEPTDSRAVFSGKAFALAAALDGFVTEANALEANVEALENSATAAAAVASNAANFRGNWSALTGALTVPSSVYHAGQYWNLLSNTADVTAITPGVSGQWAAAVGASAAAISNTPAGSIVATTVQAAINELDADVTALSASAVLLTGPQIIAGVKNFTSSVNSVNFLLSGATAGTVGYVDGSASITLYNGANATPNIMAFNTGSAERARFSGGRFLLGSTSDDGVNALQVTGSAVVSAGLAVTGLLSATSSIRPRAVPSTAWGIDYTGNAAITITAGGTYDLPAGSGSVKLHDDSNGSLAEFLCYAGNVEKLGGAADIVAGAPGASQTGVTFTGSAYRITNGYASSHNYWIATERTRTTV